MNTDQIGSFVRSLLKVISGLLAAHGLTDSAGIINGPDCAAVVLLGVSLLWSHFKHGDDKQPPTIGPRAALWLLSLAVPVLIFSGCAALDKGARPIVVRAEQSISIGNATLDSCVHIDNASRAFFKTNLPAFHNFCEWLRTPVVIAPLTNSYPRGLAIVRSCDTVKAAYKKSNSTNDLAALMDALAALETAVAEAQNYLVTLNPK